MNEKTFSLSHNYIIGAPEGAKKVPQLRGVDLYLSFFQFVKKQMKTMSILFYYKNETQMFKPIIFRQRAPGGFHRKMA